MLTPNQKAIIKAAQKQRNKLYKKGLLDIRHSNRKTNSGYDRAVNSLFNNPDKSFKDFYKTIFLEREKVKNELVPLSTDWWNVYLSPLFQWNREQWLNHYLKVSGNKIPSEQGKMIYVKDETKIQRKVTETQSAKALDGKSLLNKYNAFMQYLEKALSQEPALKPLWELYGAGKPVNPQDSFWNTRYGYIIMTLRSGYDKSVVLYQAHKATQAKTDGGNHHATLEKLEKIEKLKEAEGINKEKQMLNNFLNQNPDIDLSNKLLKRDSSGKIVFQDGKPVLIDKKKADLYAKSLTICQTKRL